MGSFLCNTLSAWVKYSHSTPYCWTCCSLSRIAMELQIFRCTEKPETIHLRFTTDDVAYSDSLGLFALWRHCDLLPCVYMKAVSNRYVQVNNQGHESMSGYWKKHWPLTVSGGVLTIVFYCLFTGISWILYPGGYGPLTHYLSRLGNCDYSPFGAWFYNLGCVLTGAMLIPFFLGLLQWHTKHMYQRMVLSLGQILGVSSAVALMAIGIFSEDQGAPHILASSIFFELNFVVLILVSIGLLLHPSFVKIFGLYGLFIDFSSLFLAFSLGGPIVEWYTVFGALVFVAMVCLNTRKMDITLRSYFE
ncbi:MAG: DUF998 domain-containing protein [Candidatus Lokiarchaeota archaeon]|nr:DUF998 domain-containing protein [Candidatus Lokiarchaeota archaeon]